MLIDLKIDKLTHQDLGQMQMYVNYYDRYQKLPDENPTIGILLCKEKNDAIVRMTLPENSNIFASEYSLYLPDKKLLQKSCKSGSKKKQEAKTNEAAIQAYNKRMVKKIAVVANMIQVNSGGDFWRLV